MQPNVSAPAISGFVLVMTREKIRSTVEYDGSAGDASEARELKPMTRTVHPVVYMLYVAALKS
jgi:hypothetical protein